MNLRRFYTAGGVVIALEAAITAWGLIAVGFDTSVPIHWNASGQADGFAPALVGFLIMPVATTATIGLMALVPRVEPRREHLRRSASAYRTMAIALVLFFGVIHLTTVLAGVGVAVPIGLVVGMGGGVLIALIGNVLGTVRSNFMFGVRTPWTLTSERSWERTHRLVGRLFVVTGLLMIAAALTGQLPLVLAVMVGMLVATIVGAFGYSYRVWRADPDRRPIGDDA
jgi:uncharacterized membrane protein